MRPAPPPASGARAGLGLAGQAAALERGEVSARELVQAALEHIDQLDRRVGAFRCLRAEAALAQAEAADQQRARGDARPLLGIPLAIKDDIDLAGESTPFGCAGNFDPAPDDCEAVRRLRRAGLVIVGKTNTPELGQWAVTESQAFGITRNPWSPGLTPGGSSGGSAAAVAAGMVPAALGSDGLGSIRIPAAWTHLVGVKPQRGRISTWPHPDPFSGLTVIGPLARTVSDAALLLDATAGSHPRDRHRPPAVAEPFAAAAARKPRRLRVALSLRAPYAVAPSRLDPRVRAQVERLATVMAELGHEVECAEPAYGVLGAGVLPRSLAGVHEWVARVPDPGLLDHRTRENARVGGLLRGPALAAARAVEPAMRFQVGRIFGRFDVVLAPTTAQPALPVGAIDGLGGWETDRLMIAACPYTWPWNVLGWPAVNVPAGVVDGSPVGAQLLGPANSEPLLLALAAELEQVESWHERWPAEAIA